MVTRVDKKPIIYNTCLLRVIRPSVVSQRKSLVEQILFKSVGHALPKASAGIIVNDYEEIDALMKMYGINDPAFTFVTEMYEEDELEAIEIARSMVRHEDSIRKALKSSECMFQVSRLQASLFADKEKIYYGTEAVYALLTEIRVGNIFRGFPKNPSKTWVTETVRRVTSVQAPYMFIHPSAVLKVVNDILEGLQPIAWDEWNMFKATETVALRLFSKRNLAAHASVYGINKRFFEPSVNPLDDFEVKINKEYNVPDGVKVYMLMGIKYICVNECVFCLSADDSINLASMAQCLFRNSIYFTRGNGYSTAQSRQAKEIANGILYHCRKLIDAGKNYSHAIRALHILAQGDFNDAFEEKMGSNLGWTDRSANYIREAQELDRVSIIFHKKIMDLARSDVDKLNVGFMYHCFVGDEMLVKDLKDKVTNMPKKVRNADKVEWTRFISFCKTYLLCRFLYVNKRKPRVAGDISAMNSVWVQRCIGGQFTMPPQSEWGKVWISKEFSYTKHADTWHLEAQDVSYVVKDTKGIIDGKYIKDRYVHSELLMAMTSGNILDIITKSTPTSARERVMTGKPCREVAITTAPKAENAKPSWKKRVTFAADCEFRKLQAEYDRNCRKIMGFVRGPSLGIDSCVLEKQFADIASATEGGVSGAICSHDISAWSESMDRARKFEFESVLIGMMDITGMDNIRLDWSKIKAIVSKQGTKEVIALDNGSFQGFDGSASTILHSLILIYCIDTARRDSVVSSKVKANMATLIDDCIALMNELTNVEEARAFWKHLKEMYLKLGFEVDDLKSIFSNIKAIYLSRRFLCGAEVPADYKVFVKTHMSYEDPLRCALDAPSDIFGALRGAADANGNAWFIYVVAVFSTLSEICYYNPKVMEIPPAGAAVFSLAPGVENGWGLPSIMDWATNDIVDKRSHFNGIFEKAAVYSNSGRKYTYGFEVFERSTGQALLAIKSQQWRLVSLSNIFTNPFEAIREGPLKPDMLKRNTVQDILRDTATAQPWVSLLAWNTSKTTERIRFFLVNSGPLHAPTLSALVNCMPDNYRLSLVGKAVGSQSLLDLLPKGARSNLKRRVTRCSQNFFDYSVSIYKGTPGDYTSQDFACLTYLERTTLEREEFYTANGCEMIDHTFPDPLATFTVFQGDTGSFIAPNMSKVIEIDRIALVNRFPKDLFSPKGMYVPRRSSRVWEITSEYAKGWDSVSQRIAMGLAVISRARADGHGVEGLLAYFVKSWNEVSNITPTDTHLISIHGSIKRLDSNPGSSTHPIITHRNMLTGVPYNIKTSLDAINMHTKKVAGAAHHLHDFLSHETAMHTAAILQLCALIHIGAADTNLKHMIAARPDCILPESGKRMTTDIVHERINVEILESEDNYGLLQSCPELAEQIAIPTMKSSWVRMINALIGGDNIEAESLRREASSTPLEDLLTSLAEAEETYSTAVVVASEPAIRGVFSNEENEKLAIMPTPGPQFAEGDSYTMAVRPVQSKFTRELSRDKPDFLVAATVIKSIVWMRLKDHSMLALSSVYYDDPDCNTDFLNECATERFWRSIVVEVAKQRKKKMTSELLMQGFRALSVPELHIRSSNDVDELVHSISSFFGANMKKIPRLIGDQITRIAGRSSKDFDKPFMQRIVTNNPTMHNIRMRKEYLSQLIKFNLDQLTERIEVIGTDKMFHNGDKKVCRVIGKSHPRLVELRCRKYVYMHMRVDENARAHLDEESFGDFIHKCAINVATRFEVPEELIPKKEKTFEDTLKFMEKVQVVFKEHKKTKKKNTGWDYVSGALGARHALDTILFDSGQVSNTKFAISSAEIAPRIYKRIRTYNPPTQDDPSSEEDDVEDGKEVITIGFDTGLGDGGFTFGVDDDGVTEADLASSSSVTGIPWWKMLYTLLYCRQAFADEVNEALGTNLPDDPSPGDLREARLDTFTDNVIKAKFPWVFSEYLNLGKPFEEDWLDRDEAFAYTVDEK